MTPLYSRAMTKLSLIRNFSIEEAQEIAKKAITMSSANEIRELLKEKSRAVWSEFLGETSM